MINSEAIVVENLLCAPIPQVWEALTEVHEMRQWYFQNIPAFKPEIGFETRFIVTSGERNFTHIWRITEVVPFKKISYTWNFEEYDGENRSNFVLKEKGSKTQLILQSHILKEFPDDIPEFKRESGKTGWEYLIKESLPKFLRKTTKV